MGLKFKGCPQKPVAFCGLLPESLYNTHMHKNSQISFIKHKCYQRPNF